MPFLAKWTAGFFGFVSGVIRNARTFHPDGRVFRGTVRSLEPSDPNLARAAEQLHGAVLMRIGMGMVKRGMPRWVADHIPDAPEHRVALLYTSRTSEIRLERRSGQDLDLLCTAGGDRLWKLLLNLATGGRKYGLQQFDYFRNAYHSDVPYKLVGGKADVWVRLMPESGVSQLGCSDSRRRPARASPYQCRGEPCGLSGLKSSAPGAALSRSFQSLRSASKKKLRSTRRRCTLIQLKDGDFSRMASSRTCEGLCTRKARTAVLTLDRSVLAVIARPLFAGCFGSPTKIRQPPWQEVMMP